MHKINILELAPDVLGLCFDFAELCDICAFLGVSNVMLAACKLDCYNIRLSRHSL